MRYKIISFLIVALMLISVIGVNATENSIRIKVADVCDEITSTTTQVPVLIENNTGIASFTIIISYDNSKLKPTAVTKGSILNGTFITNLTYLDNAIKLAYASSDDTVENGVAFFLEFELLSNKSLKTNIDIEVEFLGDANFDYPKYIAENGMLKIVDNSLSFNSRFLEVSVDGMMYNVNAEWENMTTNFYESVNLCMVAYDVNDKVVEIKRETRSFYAGEIFEISWQLHSSVPIERVKLFTWDLNMKPYIPVVEQGMYDVCIEQFTLYAVEDVIGYKILLSAGKSIDDEIVVFVAEYAADGRMLGIQSSEFKTDEYITGTLLSDDTATVKCLVWNQSNMQPKALYEEVSVR